MPKIVKRSYTPLSFYSSQSQRWVTIGCGISAVAYAVLAGATFAEWGSDLGHGQPSLLTVMFASLVGMIVARERNVIVGGMIAVMAVWVESSITLLLTTRFPDASLLGTMPVVVAAALLLRPRKSGMLALIAVILPWPLVLSSPAVAQTGVTSEVTYWLIVHTMATLAVWALVILGLSILDRTFDEVVRKERDLAETIARAPDGIMVLDANGLVQVVNPAAEVILGQTRDRAIGQPVGTVFAAADRTVRRESPVDFDSPGERPHVWTIARATGERVDVEVTWRTMDGGRRQLLLRDVSERLRAEARRREMELQLAHAQRLEAVGQLAGGIAHDFNNILTIVGASAEVLKMEIGRTRPVPLLDDILAAQERGAALTRQLLAFARRDVAQSRVFDLGEQVRSLQRLLERVGGEQVQVEVEIEPECRISADVGQVEQALVNLVANARDAMPAGGRCTVAVSRVTDDIGDTWVRMTVTDRGTGMDDATRARAFEPFFTTKPRGRGTGLGLAAVHGMILQSGGRADITSARGVGTTVTLEFPLASAPVDESSKRMPLRQPGVGGTVLIAEDDDGTRGAVARVLESLGYTVLQAADGGRATQIAGTHPGGIDLLLTDVMMPGLSGPQLAEALREGVPSLPVIFMSGYPEDALAAVPGLHLETDFLAKPFTSASLGDRVTAKLRVRRAERATI